MAKPGELSTYTTYILRCWQEGSNWRYSLEEVGNGVRHGFATLDDFVAFLLARANPVAQSEDHPIGLRDSPPDEQRKPGK